MFLRIHPHSRYSTWRPKNLCRVRPSDRCSSINWKRLQVERPGKRKPIAAIAFNCPQVWWIARSLFLLSAFVHSTCHSPCFEIEIDVLSGSMNIMNVSLQEDLKIHSRKRNIYIYIWYIYDIYIYMIYIYIYWFIYLFTIIQLEDRGIVSLRILSPFLGVAMAPRPSITWRWSQQYGWKLIHHVCIKKLDWVCPGISCVGM